MEQGCRATGATGMEGQGCPVPEGKGPCWAQGQAGGVAAEEPEGQHRPGTHVPFHPRPCQHSSPLVCDDSRSARCAEGSAMVLT